VFISLLVCVKPSLRDLKTLKKQFRVVLIYSGKTRPNAQTIIHNCGMQITMNGVDHPYTHLFENYSF